MAQRLYRTQVLLEAAQHQELAQIAAQEHRSVSHVVREMIEEQLARRRQAAKTQREQQLAALERIRQHRQEILAENGGKPLDWDVVEEINQMRDERDAEIWTILTGNSD